MTIFERIRDKWRKFLSIFRRGAEAPSQPQQTDQPSSPPAPEPTTEKPSGSPQEATSQPDPIPDTPKTEIGLLWALEGPQGKEWVRIEAWPLWYTECTNLTIIAGDGQSFVSQDMGGTLQKQNASMWCRFKDVRFGGPKSPCTVEIHNKKHGVIRFAGVQSDRQGTYRTEV